MRLIADALTCQRSGRTVFEGLSFQVEPGASLLLTGRNGAGKSSLLLILAGLLEPAGGALRAEGGDAERSLAHLVPAHRLTKTCGDPRPALRRQDVPHFGLAGRAVVSLRVSVVRMHLHRKVFVREQELY